MARNKRTPEREETGWGFSCPDTIGSRLFWFRGFRDNIESVVSSGIAFSLGGDVAMHAPATEVYALGKDRRMLLRRHYMEKYRPFQDI